jgi:ferredoxin
MSARRLRVDWQACTAEGVCAQLAPELIRLDEWGYPLIPGAPVPAEQTASARNGVSGCPTQALHLVDVPVPPGTRRQRRQS